MVWYRDHFCPEEPKDDLAYLTLPSLEMTADELRNWAEPNASNSAQWVLDHLGEGHTRDSGSAIARWAVGCQDCHARASFTGADSEGKAMVWYRDHFCPEEPQDDLAYLTLPSLDMTADELRHWAEPNASISAQWVLDHLGEGHKAKELNSQGLH